VAAAAFINPTYDGDETDVSGGTYRSAVSFYPISYIIKTNELVLFNEKIHQMKQFTTMLS
jgi:hypothetical protein